MNINSLHGDNRLTVMTLNLRFGLAEDGANNWVHRRQAYPHLFKSFPCDFYAFQEANDFQIDYLAHGLKGYELIGQRQKAPDRWQHNVIFYHPTWCCVTQDHFYLSTTPDVPSKFNQSRWPRQCTLGIFKRKQQTLICVNTHLDFDPDVQQRSAVLILQRILRHRLDMPALIMGDFNATPSSSCYAELTRDDEADRFRNAFDPAIQGGTHHAFNGCSHGAPIDWVLFRGDLKVRSTQTVKRKFRGYYPSDHFPLTATFDWPCRG